MRNGNQFKIIVAVSIFLISSFQSFSQKKKTNPELTLQSASAKFSQDCRTKSVHTLTPSIITISRHNFDAAKTVKEILISIPSDCNVICAVFSVTSQEDKIFQFMNFGNDILYRDKLKNAKTILIENLNTSCDESHKANYRINVQ